MLEKEMLAQLRPYLLGENAVVPLTMYFIKPGATVYPGLIELRDLAVKLYAKLDKAELEKAKAAVLTTFPDKPNKEPTEV